MTTPARAESSEPEAVGAPAPEETTAAPAPEGGPDVEDRSEVREELTSPETEAAAPAPAPAPAPAATGDGCNGSMGSPVAGTVTGTYGEDRGDHAHSGVDLAAPSGTTVRAAECGTVSMSGEESGYGQMVCVRHAGQTTTCYAHLSERSVGVSEYVRAGQKIGEVGCTGSCTGPHVHFEVRGADGTATDPTPYLNGSRATATVEGPGGVGGPTPAEQEAAFGGAADVGREVPGPADRRRAGSGSDRSGRRGTAGARGAGRAASPRPPRPRRSRPHRRRSPRHRRPRRSRPRRRRSPRQAPRRSRRTAPVEEAPAPVAEARTRAGRGRARAGRRGTRARAGRGRAARSPRLRRPRRSRPRLRRWRRCRRRGSGAGRPRPLRSEAPAPTPVEARLRSRAAPAPVEPAPVAEAPAPRRGPRRPPPRLRPPRPPPPAASRLRSADQSPAGRARARPAACR